MNKLPDSAGQLQTHPSDDAAPLHDRLPLEIFYTILHLCVGSTTPVRDLVTLQLVCRRWHDIIANASFLWGTTNPAEGLPAVRKGLEMAKNSLLDLRFTQHSSRSDLAEFRKLTTERIKQWRSFVVESREWESALDSLRTHKPPGLNTLHVVTDYYVLRGKKEIVLFEGDPAPGLKDVRLARVPISRAPLYSSGLKSLRLEGIPSVSAAEVIALVTQSPGLETLHLVSLDGAVLPTHTTPSQPNPTSNSPIELAFLVELNLSYLNLPFQSYLLSNVAFPRLHTLRVGCELDENPALQLGATMGLNRLDPSLNSIASGAKVYKVTLSPWSYYAIHIGRLSIYISLDEVSMDHFQETFTWLSGHLEQSLSDLPLHLNLKNWNPEPPFLEWFTHHTNVTTLTLYSNPFSEPSLDEIMPILGRPRSPPHSPPTWVLPQVEVFQTNLIWMKSELAVVDMVEGRQAASRGLPAAEVNRVVPKRFREIRLAYGREADPRPLPNADFMSKVVQVADGADVYWEGKKWIVT